MSHDVALLDFEDSNTAEANRRCLELSDFIGHITGFAVQPEIRKPDRITQDFGTTLVLALGTPFAIAIAQGIRDFIGKSGSKLRLRTPSGTFIAVGGAAENID